jgi:hypothetical protein
VQEEAGLFEQFFPNVGFERYYRSEPSNGGIAVSKKVKEDETEDGEPDKELRKTADNAEEVAGEAPGSRSDCAGERVVYARCIDLYAETFRDDIVDL